MVVNTEPPQPFFDTLAWLLDTLQQGSNRYAILRRHRVVALTLRTGIQSLCDPPQASCAPLLHGVALLRYAAINSQVTTS